MPDNEMNAGTKLQTATDLPKASAKAPVSGARSVGVDDAPKSEDHGGEHEHALDWLELARIAFVAVAAGTAWYLGPQLSLSFVIVGAICTLAGGYPSFTRPLKISWNAG
jgi:hypothetical protein